MAVNNNLYPPIVDTYMPAFLIDSNTDKDTCRVYFSLSLYNKIEDINRLNTQVTVVHQDTNANVLNKTMYPSAVAIKEIKEEPDRETDDKYYIEIYKTDLEDGNFNINMYYKVRIRFTGSNVPNAPKSGNSYPIDEWLAANQANFSEWSTICLVRGISIPTLELEGFNSASEITQWESSKVDLIGNLKFADAAESETLRSYRIRLYDKDENLLTDSEELYPNAYNNVNSFIYTIKYGLIEGDTYTVNIQYLTQNLYQDNVSYKFIVIESSTDILEADLSYTLDEENGRIGINVKGKPGTGGFVGNITIRRTSSETNFTIWEDVHTESFGGNELLDYTWYDYTLESGVWYKYAVQKRSSTGARGVIIKFKKPIMITFEDMFLTGQGKQLRLQFNPTVSSFKRNVSESNTVTIGSKYPYFNRNGYNYYRSFPIAALISSQMDDDNVFATREDVLNGQENVELYDAYNDEHRIPFDYDFTYEREYREKVEEFLMSNTVKLFRSPTEGNILVKLMDVNFQPNQTLGRRLYSFSATAYEIDDYTLENCNKYGIQFLGEYNDHLEFIKQEFGSISETIPAGKDVIEVLEEKYKKHAKDGYKIKITSLDYLRLAIEEPPYLISDGGGAPTRLESGLRRARAAVPATYLGYIVYINGKPIVINKEGIYELTNDGVNVTSLSFPVDTTITLQYNAYLNQKEDTSIVPKATNFIRNIGQSWGSFGYQDSIFNKLYTKYYERYSTYGQTMLALERIKVETEPYTVIYVKEYDEDDFERHVIGPTELLDFDNEDSSITGLYFAGIHFEEANEAEAQRDTLEGFLFKEMNETLDENTNLDFKKLYRNGVYILTDGFIQKHDNVVKLDTAEIIADEENKIDEVDNKFRRFINRILNKTAESNRYIWYNDQWWPFPETNDLLCPVEAMIDYTCQLAKGRYEL